MVNNTTGLSGMALQKIVTGIDFLCGNKERWVLHIFQ